VPFPDENDGQLRAARRNPMLMADQIRWAWEDFVHAECAARPVLLVLEDLHWGDQPTVSLVEVGLRHAKGLPFLVLALGRPEAHALFPELWPERRRGLLSLPPLSPQASEAMVRGALGEAVAAALVEDLVRRADGNAFFLEEQIRAVAEGRAERLPETVIATVRFAGATSRRRSSAPSAGPCAVRRQRSWERCGGSRRRPTSGAAIWPWRSCAGRR
jgi:eukaryotic-like serine/threonine-protein kinase